MSTTNKEAVMRLPLPEEKLAATLLPCPFDGGVAVMDKVLRDGYVDFPDDPDAYAFFCRCASCAAEGPWASREAGAARWWNMRVSK